MIDYTYGIMLDFKYVRLLQSKNHSAVLDYSLNPFKVFLNEITPFIEKPLTGSVAAMAHRKQEQGTQRVKNILFYTPQIQQAIRTVLERAVYSLIH